MDYPKRTSWKFLTNKSLRRSNKLGTVSNGQEDWLLKLIVQLFKHKIVMRKSVFAMRKHFKLDLWFKLTASILGSKIEARSAEAKNQVIARVSL